MEDDTDKKECDPDENEIKLLSALIRKTWSRKQRESRSAYKTSNYTVSIIKVSDIDLESSY